MKLSILLVADVFSVPEFAFGLLAGGVEVLALAVRLAVAEFSLITIAVSVDVHAVTVHLVVLVVAIVNIYLGVKKVSMKYRDYIIYKNNNSINNR